MRIAIVADAWYPQVNGVVRTLDKTSQALCEFGHEVEVISPQAFRTVACPTYPSIRLAVCPWPGVKYRLDSFQPHAIHIATEGPLGHAARGYCRRRNLPSTTSYHTQFPEYLRARVPIPPDWTYTYLRGFHNAAKATFVPTESQRRRLDQKGFRNLLVWSRGVDVRVFRPGPKDYIDAPRPLAMYMGRVAVEKNIEAFLDLDLPGSKYVVGDGPDLIRLRRHYPDAVFAGEKFGQELVAHLASADVFVFPSLTDTFGLVLLEAMACGVPIAAFPVTGPIDVVKHGVTGILDRDLRCAALKALQLNAQDCVDYARRFSWINCSRTFEANLAWSN
jgi:glycosyltransferase involved in cell wall biosynthesis